MPETAQHGHERPVFGCDRCIEVGNRYSAEGELPAGWAYYRVEVTRTGTSEYFIKAPSREIAELDAEQVDLDRFDFGLDDEDTYVSPKPEMPAPGDAIYTGSRHGTWETFRDQDVAS